ncbi:MAG: carboxypeptidase regulatory-like domain-containing protein [Acidobacteria bacterium]|nr:carboxypeptidase regulatory-like domain-containing protein [Acidobacteriota bacterium]
MTRTRQSVVLSLLLLLALPLAAAAQVTSSTSSVTGVVADPNGAVISGATVTLKDTRTSKEVTTTTDDQGVYRFAQVQPGQGYTITVTAAGFQTFTLSDVALRVGNVETQNVQLTAGAVSETVSVTASNEATLNTTDASIGNVIETRRLVDLPVQFRGSPAALIGLQPGVIGNNVGTGATNRVGSVTGSRADQGNITVDGIDANDVTTGQAFITTGNAPIDAIQEFRTVTVNPGAAEGRSSGGQIEMVTKSGSNEFHGSLREFNRTAATAANTFFNNRSGVKRPQLTRNQFGGSLGGPVYFPRFGEGGPRLFEGKDKLFFFFDFEGRRDAQGVTNLRIVPLAHFRQGGLAYLNNTAGCPTNARLNTRPECITVLTPAQVAALDPQHVGANAALLSLINERYPLPNDFSAGNGINTAGFRFNSPSRLSSNNYTMRGDYNITANQRMFGRLSLSRGTTTDTVNTVAQQFPQDPESGVQIVKDYALVFGHNWVATPSIVNQATIGMSRSGFLTPAPFAPTFPNVYGTPDFTGGNWSGLLSVPFPRISGQARYVPVPTYRDDLSWTRGSHAMQFGGSFKPIHQKSTQFNDFNFVTLGLGGNTPNLNASLRPGSIGTGTTRTGNYDNAFAFLLGRDALVTTNFNYDPSGNALPRGTGKTRDYRYDEWEFYGQDSWKARDDLTITYGVRWHYYPAPYEVNGAQAVQQAGADFDTIFNIRQANAAAGIAGANAVPLLTYDLGGKANNARPFYEPDWNNFGPRLSFAYNPSFKDGFLGALFGDRKMVIRGGGSVVYDRPGGGISFLQDQNTFIFANSATTNFGNGDPVASLLNDPRFTGVAALPVQNVAPAVTRPFTPFVVNGVPNGTAVNGFTYVIDPHFRIPYSIQYSFGFQREVPGNFLLDVSYVGRQGRKLFALADASQILDFKDPASGQGMIAALNGLQAQLNSGAAVTPQPWFENQVNAARAARGLAPCLTRFGVSCTNVVAANFGDLVSIGDTADTVQALYANGLLRPNVGLGSQFGTAGFVKNFGASSYNGVLVSLRKRFSQGLQFDANYTWSHSIDNQSTVANVTTSGGLICDARNLRVCRANSDFDIRHLFNMNGVWELPVGRGRFFAGDAPGWVNSIIGGWTFTGIFTARSGLPFSLATSSWPTSYIFDGNNGVPAVTFGDPNALRPSIHNAPDGTLQFFADPEAALAAVGYPRHGEPGNRNALRGPGFWNMDAALLKNFRLPWSETQRLQIRAEAYNVFNHNSFALPSSLDIGSTSFGQVTGSSSTPRVMQFGVRWDF